MSGACRMENNNNNNNNNSCSSHKKRSLECFYDKNTTTNTDIWIPPLDNDLFRSHLRFKLQQTFGTNSNNDSIHWNDKLISKQSNNNNNNNNNIVTQVCQEYMEELEESKAQEGFSTTTPTKSSTALITSNNNNNNNNHLITGLDGTSSSNNKDDTMGCNRSGDSIVSQLNTVVKRTQKSQKMESIVALSTGGSGSTNHHGILDVRNKLKGGVVPVPKWHAPWKLGTVLSSHLGWVRCLTIDKTNNEWMASGSADRTIKLFHVAEACVGDEQALKLTLTGHVSTVRGLVFSTKYPYLMSCGEDKAVKCWDLETNQVVRHYHGHLSGVYSIDVHPTVPNLMVTGGRDAVARLWDIRTSKQIQVLSGHEHTLSTVAFRSTEPQILTASHDGTIRGWDFQSGGKCLYHLTHHTKAVRTLALCPYEQSFVSGAAYDGLKKWNAKTGQLLANITHNRTSRQDSSVIIHTASINDDGRLAIGCDDGSLHFYDYDTGYHIQKCHSPVQPGSLDAEHGIYTSTYDLTGTRLLTGQADKTIQIWKPQQQQGGGEGTTAATSPETHPIDMKSWRKHYLHLQRKQRY